MLTFIVSPVTPCGIWPWLDEGERLSEQIAKGAQEMRRSHATEKKLIYSPRGGVNQRYRVAMARVHYQPHPPFEPPYPGLTVWVERGRGGFCNYHVRFVGVPQNLDVSKNGDPTEIVLRKVGDEIQVVDLR